MCAASPASTTGTERPSRRAQCTQVRHSTRGKRIQIAEPRRCAALLINSWPSSHGANSRSQNAMPSSCVIGLEPRALPDLLRRLDDERRRLAVVLVRVRLEPAVGSFGERESECLKFLRRAQPDEAAAADVDVGHVGLRVPGADAAVDAVAGDDEVGAELAGRLLIVGDVLLEHQLDAERLAPPLQDVEQPLAADAAEAVTARGDRAALEVDVDVVPVVERADDLAGGFRIGRFEIAQRLVGEHHAPAEGVVGAVALDHAHDVARVRALQQQREVKAGGTPADAQHAHVDLSSRPSAPAPTIVSMLNILNLNHFSSTP